MYNSIRDSFFLVGIPTPVRESSTNPITDNISETNNICTTSPQWLVG